MSDLSWLARHVRKDECSVAFDWIKAAFTLEGRVTGATDGVCLVAVHEASACPPVPKSQAPMVTEMLKREDKPSDVVIATTKGDLRVWCGRKPNKPCSKCLDSLTSECEECHGTGTGYDNECSSCGHVHACCCDLCHDGMTNCRCSLESQDKDVAGFLGPVLVSRDRLARAMAVELGPADESVNVVCRDKQIQIRANGWTVVLMGIDRTSAPPGLYDGADMPRFQAEKVGG